MKREDVWKTVSAIRHNILIVSVGLKLWDILFGVFASFYLY